MSYMELRQLQDILLRSLDDIASDSIKDRLTLGWALEAYLWSSVLIHGSYSKVIARPGHETAAPGTPNIAFELGSFLDWAKIAAARTIKLMDKSEKQAFLSRLYFQMANFLRESDTIPARLRALALFWRALAHGRLVLTVEQPPLNASAQEVPHQSAAVGRERQHLPALLPAPPRGQ